MKRQRRFEDGINPSSKPSGEGCVECLSSGGWWLHLRRCAECGHIGCCDSSRTSTLESTQPPPGINVVASFEPGEDWFFDYETKEMIDGPELLPPHSRPGNQPSPRPAGKVPRNWRSLLNG